LLTHTILQLPKLFFTHYRLRQHFHIRLQLIQRHCDILELWISFTQTSNSLVQLRVSQLTFIKQLRLPTLHVSFIQRRQLKAFSLSLVQLEQNLTNDKSLYLVNSKPIIQWYSINFSLLWLIMLFIEIMLLLQLAVLSPTT